MYVNHEKIFWDVNTQTNRFALQTNQSFYYRFVTQTLMFASTFPIYRIYNSLRGLILRKDDFQILY